MDNKNSFIKHSLMFIVFLICLFSISEVLVREFTLSPEEILEKQTLKEELVFNNSDNIYQLSNNPKLVYTLKPNLNFKYLVHLLNGSQYSYEINTNSEGFRDREFSFDKPDKTFRIIALGDSVTFGASQNLNQTFPKILETKLDNELDFNVEVLNMGAEGYTTAQEIDLLKVKGLKYSPDLVILSFILNDPHEVTNILEPAPYLVVQNQSGVCKIDMINLRVPCFFEHILRKSHMVYLSKEIVKKSLRTHVVKKEGETYLFFYDTYFQNKSNFAHVQQSFNELNELSQENDFAVLIVVFPIFYDFDNYQWGYAHEMVKKEAEIYDFHFVDLFPVYKNFDPKDLKNFAVYDFIHPNPKGHILAANTMYDYLIENNLIQLKQKKNVK